MADAKWAADERRLHPAFSDWSTGRYKSADAQLRQHLKKYPRSQPGLVLRLLLIGKQNASISEILSAYRDVRTTGDLSARSLWGCTLALRSAGRQDMILELHQELWERQPSSIELGEQVVLSAAGAWDTAILKTASRKMFNMTKSPTWARIAAWAEFVINVEDTASGLEFPPPASNPASLKTAQLLLSMSGKTSGTSEQLWLRLQILLAANDQDGFRKAIEQETITGNLARWWWRMEAVGVFLQRFPDEELAKAEFATVSIYLKTDKEAQRNYAFYQHLLVLARLAKIDASDIIKDLHESIGPKERAPLLAMLELTEDKSELVKQYWAKWSSTGPTLREVWDVLDDELLVQLSSGLRNKSHDDETSYRTLVNEHILHLLSRPTEWIPTDDDIRELWTLYEEGLKYGRDLPRTDVQIADRIGLASTQLSVTQYHHGRSELPLLRAVIALQIILHNSPSCTHVDFASIRLTRTIGAPSLAAVHLNNLKLSEIQLDTMLHVFVDRAAIDVHLGQTRSVLTMYNDKASQMRARSRGDLPEHIKQALENESYSKINGIRTLHRRLDRSLTAKVCLIECTRAALLDGEVKQLDTLYELVTRRDQVDSRNWELMPDIGGHRLGITKMTDMGEAVGEDWVGQWAFALVAVVSFLNGEDCRAVEPPTTEQLLPAEGEFLRSTALLINYVREVIAGEGSGEPKQIPDLFDGLIKTAGDAQGSRGEILYRAGLLAEFLNIFKLVSKRVDELAQPPSKKKKAAVHLVALSRTLKTAQEAVRPKAQEVVDMLKGLTKSDEEIVVDDLVAFFSKAQRETAKAEWKKILQARAGAVRNLVALLAVPRRL
ncbi:N-acetyltransferase B complex non catalytic subunit-domain-containing protein [Naematelia encephala]|uniref:N-acetyltransferase B complex non catalytic subunit-domain-containing protein n=1 Tax=Naematelia encephala TaxID=71784 RepID=A0A1Y2AWN9_9TREE|nr:N-acetyltransferase B complex non catalytic subunit-domain-containing protein [Naematelia encephala]